MTPFDAPGPPACRGSTDAVQPNKPTPSPAQPVACRRLRRLILTPRSSTFPAALLAAPSQQAGLWLKSRPGEPESVNVRDAFELLTLQGA